MTMPPLRKHWRHVIERTYPKGADKYIYTRGGWNFIVVCFLEGAVKWAQYWPHREPHFSNDWRPIENLPEQPLSPDEMMVLLEARLRMGDFDE